MIFSRNTIVFSLGLSLIGCDAAYEPPCRVTRREVLVSDVGPGPRTAFELHRSRDRVVASWVNLELPDSAAAAVFTVGGFEIMVVDERGGLVRRSRIAAPPELRERKGSLPAAGVVVEDGANLVYWVETVTTTDPDGRLRTAASLKAAYEGGAMLSPAPASCERCKLRVAFASLGGESIAIVRTEAQEEPTSVGLLGASPAPAFVALLFHRSGTVAEIEVPWLVPPRPRQPIDAGAAMAGPPDEPELSLEVDGSGRLVLVTDRHAWSVTGPTVLGPVPLPAHDARIAWSNGGEASLAWSVAPFDEGRSTASYAQREIFTGSAPVGSTGVSARERVSRGRALLAADRNGSEIGVLFESAGRTLFAAVDPAGRKRGGDLVVRSAGEPTRAGEFGAFVPDGPSMLIARGGGAFTIVMLDSFALETAEIACAP